MIPSTGLESIGCSGLRCSPHNSQGCLIVGAGSEISFNSATRSVDVHGRGTIDMSRSHERHVRRDSHFWAVTILVFSLSTLPSVGGAEEWGDDDAAETTSGQLEDHEARAGDPDAMTAQSKNPNEMVVESESLEGRVVEAENPASMLTVTDDPDSHKATSKNLSNLREEKPDVGFREIEVSGQSEWLPTTDPEVLRARKNLLRAEERARTARTAYGEANRRNYPRGEARERIVNERDASMKALAEAKRALAETE